MVSFVCDECQETVKKPKVPTHLSRCGSYSVSCIDCGKSFGRNEFNGHISCITEDEKYQKALYKGKKGGDQNKQQNMNQQTPNKDAPIANGKSAPTPPSASQNQKQDAAAPSKSAEAEKIQGEATKSDEVAERPKKKQKKSKEPDTASASPSETKEGDAEQNGHEKKEDEGAKKRKKKSKTAEAEEPVAASEKVGEDAKVPEAAADSDVTVEEMPKVKKVIRRQLRLAPSQQQRKKLLIKAVVAELVADGCTVPADKLRPYIADKIAEDTRLVVDGKIVKLRPKTTS